MVFDRNVEDTTHGMGVAGAFGSGVPVGVAVTSTTTSAGTISVPLVPLTTMYSGLGGASFNVRLTLSTPLSLAFARVTRRALVPSALSATLMFTCSFLVQPVPVTSSWLPLLNVALALGEPGRIVTVGRRVGCTVGCGVSVSMGIAVLAAVGTGVCVCVGGTDVFVALGWGVGVSVLIGMGVNAIVAVAGIGDGIDVTVGGAGCVGTGV